VGTQNGAVYRFGYDLFGEIGHLLGEGQPAEYAHIPTLDLHIDLLRQTILKEGLPLVEIPPAPAGRDFIVCLTHDIDFIGIRDHFLDHTMWGFLYRSILGAFRDYIRGRISFERLARIWAAAISLPLIYLGLKKDYWIPFDWYLKVEKGLSPTYYFIPFKNRQGEKVSVPHAERRATAYDVTDLSDWSKRLADEGCEIGVHGIDAWHDPAKGREELGRVNNATGQTAAGIRMHWLLRDASTYQVLEQAGYQYDSTSGYNEAVGYRNGTAQVFRPLTAETLLELPLHIQDGALFFPQKLGLSEADAWELCQGVIDKTREHGGIVTVLWHDRSHGPERFWGEFYAKLVEDLKGKKVWFASGSQAVGWFNRRRHVTFEHDHGTVRARIPGEARGTLPPMAVRVYPAQQAQGFSRPGAEPLRPIEHHWTGERELKVTTTHVPTPYQSFSAADNVLAPGV
jgi:hypothetical protein